MWHEAKKRVLNLLCGFLVMSGVANAWQQTENDDHPLQIRLRPTTQVTNSNVRLTDIATFFQNDRLCPISHLSENQRRQLRKVTVVRLNQKRPQATVTRHSINIRLQVLGLPNDEFELIGPDAIVVEMVEEAHPAAAPSPFHLLGQLPVTENPHRKISMRTEANESVLTDLSIEQSIQQQLASQFGIPEDGIQVRLQRSVIGPNAKNLKDVKNPVVQVTAPVKMPYGRQSLLVRVLDGSRIAMMQSVTVDVRQRQRLLKARRPLAIGTRIDASMLTEEIQFTDREYDQLSIQDVVGMVAARPLRASEIIVWNNLRKWRAATAAQVKPVVLARDAVKVLATHKALRVTVSAAQALESGRPGQVIRVRNIQSGKAFSARVVRAGEVQLVL